MRVTLFPHLRRDMLLADGHAVIAIPALAADSRF